MAVRRRLAIDRLFAKRVVIRLDSFGPTPSYRRGREFWLITERGEVDLRVKDPRAELELYMSAGLRSFARIWPGVMWLSEAPRAGGIRLAVRRELVRRFPSSLLLSQFAETPRPNPAWVAVR